MTRPRAKQLNIDADLPVNSNKITGLASGTASTDAVNKGQLDAAVAGLDWLSPPAATRGYLGTRTVAQIDALSPAAGDTVVAGDAGTPAAGTSDLLATGDVAEFDGTSWKKIVANSGGFPPDGTRLLVHTETATLFSPLTDGTDEGKLADFDGTSLTPALSSPTDGQAVMVGGEASVNENRSFVYDGTIPSGDWIQFSGLQPTDAGAGLSKSGSVLNVGDVNRGIQANADSLEIDGSEIASTGLEEDATNSWQLRLATQGDGIAGGAGSTLSVQANGDSVDVSASGVKAAVPVRDNKGMTGSVTASDGDQATATTVAKAPGGDSYIALEVNGIFHEVGDGVKTKDAYISSDGGTTARTFAAVVATDTIHWNGSIAGYELDASDVLSLHYNNAAP